MNAREAAAANEWFWLDQLILPLGLTDSDVVAPFDFLPPRRGPQSSRHFLGGWTAVAERSDGA